jgi:hypothetical protein
VGYQYDGLITDVYATGDVSGGGGLVGLQVNDEEYNTIVHGYFDVSTTGSGGSWQGTIGETTAQLQGKLPSGFSSSVWSTGLGLYPYLTNFFPNGAQAVSGVVYSDGGLTRSTGGSVVSAIAGGKAFGSASAGADGYYYVLGAASITSGQSLLTYDAATDAATLTTAAGSGGQSGVNLYASTMTVPTTATTLTAAPILAQAQTSGRAADGGVAAAATVIGDVAGLGLVASGASFTLNAAPATSLLVKTTAGSIAVDAPFTLAGSDYLTLDSYQSITIDAPVAVSGAGAVSLVTNDGGSGGDYGFGFTGASFTGRLSFTGGEHSGATLAINGYGYALVYSLSELSTLVWPREALATSLTDTAGYSGAISPSLSGTFTGLGNTITGLNIGSTASDVGLFGTLDSGGVIRDLGLVGGSVTGNVGIGALVGNDAGLINDVYATTTVSGTSDVGGLAGYEAFVAVVSNATTSGATVSGSSAIGGLVGKSIGTIEDASSSDAVSGREYVGGAVGYDQQTVIDVSVTGSVTGTGGDSTEIGGLAGYSSGSISGSSAETGKVSGATEVGGLVGYNDGTGLLSNDLARYASVSGVNSVGGLVGENDGAIGALSSSWDTVSGSRYVGGLVGDNTGTIDYAGALGSVSGTTEVGGLTGVSSGEIVNASADGAVVGTSYVGGLVGENTGNITAARAIGSVTGTGNAPLDLGGLVGENSIAGIITKSQATGGSVIASNGTNIGGLVGANAGQISLSFAADTVGSDGTGSLEGGLVGYNPAGGTIANAYATGQVEAGTYIGGLIGENGGSVQTSWASGAVATGATSGGVAGDNASPGIFTDVYWDVGATGLANPLGQGTLGSSTNILGIGGTTGRNPDSHATYAGFNFTSVWTISPGASRPYLLGLTPQTPPK